MSNLKQLKEKFDKVIIKYTEKACEIALVDGLNVYLGLSICHENDSFNRKLGRKIALGRAEFAFKLAKGEKNQRKRKAYRADEFKIPLYQSETFDDVVKLDEFIIDFLPKRRTQEAS